MSSVLQTDPDFSCQTGQVRFRIWNVVGCLHKYTCLAMLKFQVKSWASIWALVAHSRNGLVSVCSTAFCIKMGININEISSEVGLFRSSKSSSICSTGRPETSTDCLFYWSIFPIIYYVCQHTLKFFKSAWNICLLQWRMKKTWSATFADMWTARFSSFTPARDYDKAREFKRFSVGKMWRKPFWSAFAQ